jgi:GDP-D-mannose dehydratase
MSLLRGDLHDIGSIVTAIRESEAEVVFHLAAQSFVPYSFASPMDTYVTNVIGTINVLEALRLASHDVIMHFAGSSEEYGLVLAGSEHYEEMLRKYGAILPLPRRDKAGTVISETPVKETNPLRTVGTSPYGSSKRQAEDACRTYVSCYGSKVHLTRAFNHTGPRRGNEFVSSEITRQIALGVVHGRTEMRLGNLSSIRDFNDVREIALGYLLSIEKGSPGEVYNLASGIGTSIRDLLNLARTTAEDKFRLRKMSYRMDETRLRPTDLPILVGDATKAKDELGWRPQIPLERTILEMIEFNIGRV